jgi:hypothetical protein
VIANQVLKAWTLILFVSLGLSVNTMAMDVSGFLGDSDGSYSSEALETVPMSYP